MTILSVSQAEFAFEQAWNHPSYTQIQLDDIDINQALEKANISFAFTRQHLWEAEVKKAYNPSVYIPHVAINAKWWGKKVEETGNETFVRSSWQRQWLDARVHKEVFEQVFVNHEKQCVTFLGEAFLTDEREQTFTVINDQPLFHVQHAVGGDANQPKNVWRIVHLTEKKDHQLIEAFKNLNHPTQLPKFVQVYLTKDRGMTLPSV